MTAADVLVKIRTFFDRKGATEATDALKQTAATAKQTGQQVSQSGKSGADGLNLMSVATAAMQGNFQAAASAAVPLIEKSKAAGLSLTQLSLAGAALTAVVAGLKALSDWADAAAQRITRIQMDNLTNKVKASAAAYEDLVTAMRNSEAQKDAALAFNNSMIDSYTRQALAVNELNKQKELASTADESKRREIESRYASKADSINGMSAVQKEANDRARSLEREAQIEKAIEASKERQSELVGEATEGLKKGQNASSTVRGNLGFWRNLMDKGAMSSSYLGIAKEAGVLTGEAITKAKDEERRREQLEQERLEIRRTRELASVDARSGSITRAASDVASQTAASDRQRANQEDMYKEGERFQANLSQYHPSDQAALIDEMNRMAKNGELTVEALRRRNDMDERIIKAWQDSEARMRNIQ
jgi:hypothetical protein